MGSMAKYIGLGFMILLQFENVQVSMAHEEECRDTRAHAFCSSHLHECLNNTYIQGVCLKSCDLCPTPAPPVGVIRFYPGCCGYGVCTGFNECVCNDGYPLNHPGRTCEYLGCPGGCGKGRCTGINRCKCPEGYTGNRCEKPICPSGCPNGKCISLNMCKCRDGYKGNNCDKPVCPSGCVMGICTAPSKCTCISNYKGPTCEIPDPRTDPQVAEILPTYFLAQDDVIQVKGNFIRVNGHYIRVDGNLIMSPAERSNRRGQGNTGAPANFLDIYNLNKNGPVVHR